MYSSIYGTGLNDIKLFKGQHRLQTGKNLKYYGGSIHYIRGRGLGNIFRGIWGLLSPVLVNSLPYIRRGAQYLARQGLEGAAEVFKNNLQTERSLKDLASEEASKRLANIADKASKSNILSGSGIGRKGRARRKNIKRNAKQVSSVIRGLLLRKKGDTPKNKAKRQRKNPNPKKRDINIDNFFN